MKKLTRVIFGLAIVLLMALVTPALSANYDLVINNGRVMDPETMYDRVANVGIKDGRIAVITIFDPEKITDNATYEKGIVPSTGIPYVIVNGTIMVKDSEVVQDATFSGQPIRFEPVKSRFEPLTIENWQKTYYASPVDFGGGVPGSQPRRMGAPDVQPDTHGHYGWHLTIQIT